MKRALCVVLVCVASSACLDWDGALTAWQSKQGTADGARCGKNEECASKQCRAGVCVAASSMASGENPCGDFDDCQSGSVCEPRSKGQPYLCSATPLKCVNVDGRLAKMLSDCTGGEASCTSAAFDNGICLARSCGMDTARCSRPSECCPGLACNGSDGGVCVKERVGDLPDAFPCESSDQCRSRFCLAPQNICQPPTANCVTVGNEFVAGRTCCSGTTNTGGKCCLANSRSCQSDSACCSGQCLAGQCVDRKPATAQADTCRQLTLLCNDDNDCCSGLCDARRKQCSETPTLADGGTCTFDVKSRTCTFASGGSCKTPSGACVASSDCCSGSCESSTGTCF